MDEEKVAEEEAKEELPYGVGKLSGRWLVFIGLMAVVFIVGLYAWIVQFTEGHVVTGLRNTGTMGGTPWGLYIVFLIYFVGISFAGITIAALIRLLDLKHLRPLSRMAELLTVVSLLLATLAVLPDLGRPFVGIVNLFLYARPQSPFFGTFTLVIVGYFFGSLVYLYLGSRADASLLARMKSRLRSFYRFLAAGYTGTEAQAARHRRASFWLAIAIVPILVAAHSTLGFVFGLQVGRPGWYSALQAPAFVALAAVSGLGALIVLAATVRWSLRGPEKEKVGRAAFETLGKMLLLLVLVYLYFMLTELLTMTYTGHHHEAELATALLSGEFAWLYWGSVVLLAVPLAILAGQAYTKRWSVSLLALNGVLVNVAAIVKRYVIVVPSLTHGSLLPYGPGQYIPTWVEYSVVISLFALGAILIGLFAKVFPIVEIGEGPERGAAHA